MGIIKLLQKVITALQLLLLPFLKIKKDVNFKRAVRFTRYYEKLSIEDNVILYESSYGNSMTDSPYAIFKKIINDPRFNNYKHIWALNSDSAVSYYTNLYKELKNVEFVEVHDTKYLKYLSSARYLINNYGFPSYFQKKEGQIYVNTWHGTQVNKIGKYGKGEIGHHKNIQRNLIHSNFILAPNKYSADKIIKSHDLDGLYNGNIVVEGSLRSDLTLNPDREMLMNGFGTRLKQEFNNKKVILFAPTWKLQDNDSEDNERKILHRINEIVRKIPDEYQILLKVHYSLYKTIVNDQYLKEICVPNWIETNELLSAVDILVSDYSSIVIDFLVTKKPIIFYMNNKQISHIGQSLFVKEEKMPGPICSNTEELINAIKVIDINKGLYCNNYSRLLEEYCVLNDGFSTDRIIDIIFNSNPTKNVYKVKNAKKNILFYCGGFLNNGITTSAINLLNNLDYSRYNIVVVDKGEFNQITGRNFKRLNNNVKQIFRVGIMNVTISEFYMHRYITKKGLVNKKLHNYIPVKLYQREISRLFGDVRFDIVIDFSGYVPFWTLLFAFGKFKHKSIYMHNDMKAESIKRVNNKYKHKSKMNLIFPLYQYFDSIVSVSKHTRDINLHNLKDFIPREKAVYSNNTIDYIKVLEQVNDPSELDTFNRDEFFLDKSTEGIKLPNQENLNFASVGRLSPEKDHQKLLKAFSKFVSSHKNARLYIIGDGPLEASLKELAVNLEIDNKVIFTGHLTNPFYLLKMCDCLILPSNHEGQPMIILEALIIDLPIIATDIPGSRSILENGYGELVINSEDGLIKGMEKFASGKIASKKFDFVKYNNEALNMFYENVCNIEMSKNQDYDKNQINHLAKNKMYRGEIVIE
ncbi:CDP-glycerol glycerophosphotransferase family protein [Mesobacillus maritimus]|uniref:glycosyltransferase n=1 Tax=Mesobacillus maritimus TaxID=1643336 RepID=UPI0020415FE8|nr:glycosyltransferase [Mesobacillus maritimus]MCM3585200.1 CDP-glycerol glycerophosphotransferase family protein [Mesobacillus maritimus]